MQVAGYNNDKNFATFSGYPATATVVVPGAPKKLGIYAIFLKSRVFLCFLTKTRAEKKNSSHRCWSSHRMISWFETPTLIAVATIFVLEVTTPIKKLWENHFRDLNNFWSQLELDACFLVHNSYYCLDIWMYRSPKWLFNWSDIWTCSECSRPRRLSSYSDICLNFLS